VTRGTGNAHVSAGERKRGLAVIKSRGLPGGGVMAYRASSWDSALRVIRIIRAVVILDVAGHAIGWCSRKLPSDVTRIARYVHMSAGERKDRLAVIEVGGLPG